eukprot:scaffold90850_cov69-Phaeocystis_antarctica.AAC.3
MAMAACRPPRNWNAATTGDRLSEPSMPNRFLSTVLRSGRIQHEGRCREPCEWPERPDVGERHRHCRAHGAAQLGHGIGEPWRRMVTEHKRCRAR